MAMQTIEELFEHELQDLYSGEHALVDALEQMASESVDREIKRVRNGRVFLIPPSADTRGHGTTGQAKFYKQALDDLLKTAPQKGM